MTSEQYNYAVTKAEQFDDRGEYLAIVSNAEIWGNPPANNDLEVALGRKEELKEIWDAVHRSVKDISAYMCTSNRKLAEKYAISIRTLEKWSNGVNKPPLYLMLLIQRDLGLLNVPVTIEKNKR